MICLIPTHGFLNRTQLSASICLMMYSFPWTRTVSQLPQCGHCPSAVRALPTALDGAVALPAAFAQRDGRNLLIEKAAALQKAAFVGDPAPEVGHIVEDDAGYLSDLKRDAPDMADVILCRNFFHLVRHVVDDSHFMHIRILLPAGTFSAPETFCCTKTCCGCADTVIFYHTERMHGKCCSLFVQRLLKSALP